MGCKHHSDEGYATFEAKENKNAFKFKYKEYFYTCELAQLKAQLKDNTKENKTTAWRVAEYRTPGYISSGVGAGVAMLGVPLFVLWFLVRRKGS